MDNKEKQNLNQDLIKRENILNEKEKNLNQREQKIIEREKELKNKEFVIESQIDLKIAELQSKKIEEMNQNILKIQKGKMDDLEKIENRRLNEIEQFEKNKMIELEEIQRKKINEIQKLSEERKKITEEKNRLEEEKIKINDDKEELIYLKEQYKRNKKEIGNENKEFIETTFDSLKDDYQKNLMDLKEIILKIEKENTSKESFEIKYGDTKLNISKKIDSLTEKVKELEKELSTRPTVEVLEQKNFYEIEYKKIKEKCEKLSRELEENSNSQINLRELQTELKVTSAEKRNLEIINEANIQEINKLRSEINRFKVLDEEDAGREERIKEIKNKYIDLDKVISGEKVYKNELEFINNIWNQCKKYEFNFNKRIISAFHTALKISDWSIITVLAGVSGTGKSELPRLYSAFGGLNFISVPVQPNWDSQESMLGYFNSIDNRFDAQPLLRFLAQVTDENDELSQYMSIVLLDEMNLAHVEYYFAEFLSKLELRRGTTTKNLPSIEIKLGAGIKPYDLKLTRTLLWIGTMNQDETTKSLSDKVLDRGIVINFPRPSKMSTRKNMKSLNKFVEESKRSMLSKEIWNDWVVRGIKDDESEVLIKEIAKCKEIIENINDSLKHCGRALGHRVWQSVQYYIINHPLVIAAKQKAEDDQTLKDSIRFAFEDQIVQKVMPKLRGIETTGNGRKTLDAIKEILTNNNFEDILIDFSFAEEIGYGQFIWSSAEYIQNSEAEYEKLEEKLLGE